jgi:putative transposase
MADDTFDYKTIRHCHEPGDCHELTFSCYRRWPLLTDETWRAMLAESLERALAAWCFRLAAYVFMPEHVHLLVYPCTPGEAPIDKLLKAIKRPYSFRVKCLLKQAHSPLLRKLTIRDRPGVTRFRYWQEGPGYDRNLASPQAVLAAMEYIHLNPVRRGLCQRAADWKWSSCRHYEQSTGQRPAVLPTIHGLPADYLSG